MWYLPRMGGSSSNNGLGGSGADGVTNFMSYAGPVFPLTLAEENGLSPPSGRSLWTFNPGCPGGSLMRRCRRRSGLGEESYDKILSDLRESFPDGGYSSGPRIF